MRRLAWAGLALAFCLPVARASYHSDVLSASRVDFDGLRRELKQALAALEACASPTEGLAISGGVGRMLDAAPEAAPHNHTVRADVVVRGRRQEGAGWLH